MQVSSYLRLQLLFGENKAPTFKKNLEKMITLILFDVEKRARETKLPTGLTVVGIIEKLKEVYYISFSDSEVLDSINAPHQTRIVCSYIGSDYVQNEYSISPDEYVRLEARENDNKLLKSINLFLEENVDVEYSAEEFLDLLQRHFYTVFNSNTATLLDLINRNYEYTKNLDIQEFNFSYDEKNAINLFLYWDNAEKNKCVYELVSCCFDYCMITAHQGSDVYRNIFNQKVFFLDANIVFRMMGVNHINRKKVIDAFINKCKLLNISVRVTNTTVQEIEDTIAYHVRVISTLFGKKEPLDSNLVTYLNSSGGTTSFYVLYYNWCKDSSNRVSDYHGFERYLKRKAGKIIGEFKQQNFDSFLEIDSKQFNAYVDSLSSYKIGKGKSVYAPSIQTDVNNFMYVSSLNDRENATDFFGTHYYLISADHAFCDWVKQLRPGAIPIVVLPSVWYSIMLQYSSRTEDDYASFTSFLNFSMSNNESDNSIWKLEVLKKIIAIDETAEVRNEVGFSITEKLKSGAVHDLDANEIDEVVQEAYHSVVNQKVLEAREEERQKANAQIESYKIEFQNKISNITNSAETDVVLAKAETERIKAEAAEERVKAEKKLKEQYESGLVDAKNNLIDNETRILTKKTYRKYWIITILMIILSLGALIGMFVWLARQQTLSEGMKLAFEWLKYLIALVAFGGNGLIINKVFCGLDYKKIEDKVQQKIVEKYNYLMNSSNM